MCGLVAGALLAAGCDSGAGGEGGGDGDAATEVDAAGDVGEDAAPGDTGPDVSAPDTAPDVATDGGADAAPEVDVPKPPVLRPGWCTRENAYQGTPTSTATQVFDAQGRRLEVRIDDVDPGGAHWKRVWSYDAQGRVTSVDDVQVPSGEVSADRDYTRDPASGLVTRVDFVTVGAGSFAERWDLEVVGGRYRSLRAGPNAQWRDELVWDEANDRLDALNVIHVPSGDVVEFEQYQYKPMNPGKGKLQTRSADVDFEDGKPDYVHTYGYQSTWGYLTSWKTRRYGQDGAQLSETTTEWEYVGILELGQVESESQDGEVQVRYTHKTGGDLVVEELVSGCVTTWQGGEVVEVQTKGGVEIDFESGFTPEVRGARAFYRVEGRRLRTVCAGETTWEATYDQAGNLLALAQGDSTSTFGYACWE